MVYAIVKNHGGSIDCLSKPGEGTTFNIYFPVTDLDNRYSKAEEEKGEKEVLTGTETILLVDDERAILETGKEMLKRYGYQIITAENGEEAISKYSHASVNLVVLDIGMPGMGGLKCLNKLLTIDNRAKIIISSGYSMNGRINEALKSGAKAFVAKPYRLKEILKTVRKILDT